MFKGLSASLSHERRRWPSSTAGNHQAKPPTPCRDVKTKPRPVTKKPILASVMDIQDLPASHFGILCNNQLSRPLAPKSILFPAHKCSGPVQGGRVSEYHQECHGGADLSIWEAPWRPPFGNGVGVRPRRSFASLRRPLPERSVDG